MDHRTPNPLGNNMERQLPGNLAPPVDHRRQQEIDPKRVLDTLEVIETQKGLGQAARLATATTPDREEVIKHLAMGLRNALAAEDYTCVDRRKSSG